MDNWGKMNTYVYDEVIYQIVWNINVRVAEEGESLNFNGINKVESTFKYNLTNCRPPC